MRGPRFLMYNVKRTTLYKIPEILILTQGLIVCRKDEMNYYDTIRFKWYVFYSTSFRHDRIIKTSHP